MDNSPAQTPKTITWWAIWMAALAEAGILYVFLAPGEPKSMDGITGIPGEMIVLVPLGLSILIRWGGLGFVRKGSIAFVLFLAGVSLAVLAADMSLFLGEYFGRELFTVSVLGILQFAPLFARQYFES
jgi:hypothetical protein